MVRMPFVMDSIDSTSFHVDEIQAHEQGNPEEVDVGTVGLSEDTPTPGCSKHGEYEGD